MDRRPQNIDTRSTRHAARGAFTLVEMLVTVALVTVLMLAVTQIFSIASATLGGAQALGAAVRDAQAAQVVMARDLSAAASDAPFFIIRSERWPAPRNRTDDTGDIDNDLLTFDFNGDNTEEAIPLAYYNFRNHRQDTLVFFTRDRYERMTGDSSFVAGHSAGEAMVWYGHLKLPDNNGQWTGTLPGRGSATSNPNNYFASQWILGRVAMLLIDPINKNTDGTGGVVDLDGSTSSTGDRPAFYQRKTTSGLAPLAQNTQASNSTTTTIDSCRLDLAGTSVSTYRNILASHIVANPTDKWWEAMMGGGGTNSVFRCNPFSTRPLDAEKASQQVPVFVSACSQFMVEFAGDYITQNWDPDNNGKPDEPADIAMATYGAYVAPGPDGRTDTIPGTRQIMWYGMPRDTNANGKITANDGDVVPVRDVVGGATAFERELPTPSVPTAAEGYLSTTAVTTLSPYVCAWGPDQESLRPKMVRITISIDRPEAEGKLLDGQYFEYVFNVGY